MDSEERLAQTFRKIHARRASASALYHLRSTAAAVGAIALAGIGIGAWMTEISAGPSPWWLFAPAIFGARLFGDDLAGWMVVVVGCVVSALLLPVAPEVIGAPASLGYILTRVILLICIGGARSLSAPPRRYSPEGWPLPTIFRSNHLGGVSRRDTFIDRIC